MKRITFAGLLLLAATVEAGTVLEITNRDLTNKNETQAKTYAQDGKLRIETGGAQDSFAIFRDDTIYTFDPKQKTYVALDRATIKKLADQLNPALKMLQEQMANMPPEQRAQMERMLGTSLSTTPAPPEEIRKTSRTGSAAGYSCTYAEVWQGGVKQSEACVVPEAKLQGSKELYDAGVKVSALLKDMIDSIDLGMLKQMSSRQMENFEKLGGIPVVTRTFDNGSAVHEAIVTKISNEKVANSLFDIPAGYKQQQMPSVGGVGR